MNKYESIILITVMVLFCALVIYLSEQQKPKDRYFLVNHYTKETVYVDTTKKYYYENVDSSVFMYRWVSTWADTVELIKDTTLTRQK